MLVTEDLVDRLQIYADAYDSREAAAEIKRLREDNRMLSEVESETWKAMRLEIERLRAALQAILDESDMRDFCLWDAQQIARRALERR